MKQRLLEKRAGWGSWCPLNCSKTVSGWGMGEKFIWQLLASLWVLEGSFFGCVWQTFAVTVVAASSMIRCKSQKWREAFWATLLAPFSVTHGAGSCQTHRDRSWPCWEGSTLIFLEQGVVGKAPGHEPSAEWLWEGAELPQTSDGCGKPPELRKCGCSARQEQVNKHWEREREEIRAQRKFLNVSCSPLAPG